MENNEIMNFEDVEVVETDIEVCENSGIGTGVAMLIGAGITAAVGAGVVLGKKLVAKWKAKKELKKPDKEIPAEKLEIPVEVATK
jgi:hypothetical protein